MCGRFFIDESPEFLSIVEAVNRSPLASQWRTTTAITTSGEIRPTNVVPVIASNRSGKQTIFPMKWGFTADYGNRPLLINARVETASVKPTFKEAWQSHRCIVPASYYFEWEHRLDADGKKKTGDKFITVLTQEINSSKNSRLFMEEAYSTLINNTYPNAVDSRTLSQLTDLLDTLENYRMIAVKRDRLSPFDCFGNA